MTIAIRRLRSLFRGIHLGSAPVGRPAGRLLGSDRITEILRRLHDLENELVSGRRPPRTPPQNVAVRVPALVATRTRCPLCVPDPLASDAVSRFRPPSLEKTLNGCVLGRRNCVRHLHAAPFPSPAVDTLRHRRRLPPDGILPNDPAGFLKADRHAVGDESLIPDRHASNLRPRPADLIAVLVPGNVCRAARLARGVRPGVVAIADVPPDHPVVAQGVTQGVEHLQRVSDVLLDGRLVAVAAGPAVRPRRRGNAVVPHPAPVNTAGRSRSREHSPPACS